LQKNKDSVEEIITRKRGTLKNPSERGGDTEVCKIGKEGVAEVQNANNASEEGNSE